MPQETTRPDIGKERTLCVICAWRAACQRKFTFEQAGSGRCLDYSRDLTLPTREREQK